MYSGRLAFHPSLDLVSVSCCHSTGACDLRWESDVEWLYRGTSTDFGQAENPLRGYRVGTGLASRTTWGLFRLKLSYLDLEGR